MSWFNISRRNFILGGTTALASCGFEPVLGSGSISDFRGKVALPNAGDKDTYIMRRELEKFFGQPKSPIYELSYTYAISTRKLAEAQSNIITRSRLTAEGEFLAKDLRTDTVIMDQSYKRTASYSSNSDLYASDRAQIATEEKLIESLAKEFAMRFVNAANSQ